MEKKILSLALQQAKQERYKKMSRFFHLFPLTGSRAHIQKKKRTKPIKATKKKKHEYYEKTPPFMEWREKKKGTIGMNCVCCDDTRKRMKKNAVKLERIRRRKEKKESE